MSLAVSTVNAIMRIGNIAKGLVYFLMGVFCIGTVFGVARGTIGPKDTIAFLGQTNSGQILYFILGVGIAFYAFWRSYEGIMDPNGRGKSYGALFYRLNCLVVGGAYTALAIYAFRRLFRLSGGGGDLRKDGLQLLLSLPYGEVITYIIAALVVFAGVSALYTGVTNQHVKDVEEWGLSDAQRKVFRAVGVIGLVGVALVYFIMAYGLYRVAKMSYAENFLGVGEALSYLEGWSRGLILMLITGIGLLFYGIFMNLLAWYQQRPDGHDTTAKSPPSS